MSFVSEVRSGVRRLVWVAFLVVLAVACSGGGGSRAKRPAAPQAPGSNLFAASASGGTFQKDGDRRYNAKLIGVSSTVVRFTDRPARAAAAMTTASLVNSWDRIFGNDPPSAALVVTEAKEDENLVVVTLTKPLYDERNETLRFSGTLVGDVAVADRLGFSAGEVDASLAPRFADATLFIDSAPPTTSGAAFYVSFSGGSGRDSNNVRAYTVTGEEVTKSVLSFRAKDGVILDELRGMAIAPDQTLFVANAHLSDSMVLAFGPDSGNGTRELIGGGPFSSHSPDNPGLLRPYGLALDPTGNLLVSSQDTAVVTRLSRQPPGGAPAPVAPALQSAYPDATFLAGTVVPAYTPDPSLPPREPAGLEAPRGIAVDGSGTLYAADSGGQVVRAYDATTGAYTADVLTAAQNNGNPVGLFVSGPTLYVTNEGTNNVVAVNLTDNTVAEVVRSTTGAVTLDQPAGVTEGPDGALYVVSRRGRQILRFDLSSGTGSVFIDRLTEEPEQVITLPASASPA